MDITFEQIKEDPQISTLLLWANRMLESLGYTEHGPRHTGYVARVTADILRTLGYPDRLVELGAITGWVHDVGNGINRQNHALTGATLLFGVLREIGMPLEEVCQITAAVGNHEEQTGSPVTPLAAALILADKSDAHRTRVRKGKSYDATDIHDRVNYAISQNRLLVMPDTQLIRYELEMDNNASVMDFLQIYQSRMVMSEKAARALGCTYQLVINGMQINRYAPDAQS